MDISRGIGRLKGSVVNMSKDISVGVKDAVSGTGEINGREISDFED